MAEIGGRYRLEEEIGHGGMGTVWRAFDQRLRRHVALKRMSADQIHRPAARQRFEQEAFAIARLKNPHVVQIHDYGIDEDVPYLVIELLEGEDLSARIQRVGKLPLPAVAPLIAQIAKALDVAHASGLVHRDLKPDNVFLARGEGGEETVKVLDFGLAALVASLGAEDGDRTSRGTILGTPHYMSPEQVRGSTSVDHRSDLWALGILAYCVIVGKLPFASNVVGELLVSVCVDTPVPPSSAVQGLPPALDAFFERALAKEPLQRFQSARELARALADALAPSSRPSKLLVVDDEPDIAALLKRRFRNQIRDSVYELVFASNGGEALDALRVHADIDVTLTDIRMPGMDGLTLLARCRDLCPTMPVIVVSAFGDMAKLRTAMNLGAFDFLVKPIDFNDLDATIQKALQHGRDLRAAARSAAQNTALRMFVGGRVAEKLRDPLAGLDSLAEELIDATVVALRVCGFDGPVEHAPPAQTLRHLNASLEVAVPEIVARGGVVEKLVGSAIIAVFQGELHEVRALAACVSVRDQLDALAVNARGEPAYLHGVCAGVASGKILRGCIGSKASARLDDAILGEAATTATRLALRATRHEILVPDPVQASIGTAFELSPRSAEEPERDLPPVWSVARWLGSRSSPTAPTAVVGDSNAPDPFGSTGPVGTERHPASQADASRK